MWGGKCVLCGPSYDSVTGNGVCACSFFFIILFSDTLISDTNFTCFSSALTLYFIVLKSSSLLLSFLFLALQFLLIFILFSRPHLQGQVVALPTLAAPKKDHLQEQTSIAPLERNGERCSDLRAKESQNREEDWRKGGAAEISSGGCSWTVGDSRCTAQWVRKKQEFRSTRPW